MKPHLSIHKKIKIITVCSMFLFFLAYVVIRASLLSFTHDESISFSIIEGNTLQRDTANNHLLNTLLMGWSKKIFGNSELSLRLPNILAFIIYFFALHSIVKQVKGNHLFLTGLILGVGSSFLMEFFSLARGYGLSIAFMLLSIHYLLRNHFHYNDYRSFCKDYFYGALFATLSMLASLVMVNYFLLVILLFALKLAYILIQRTGKSPQYLFSFFIVTVINLFPFIAVMKRLLFLKARKELYFGSETFQEVLDSLLTPANNLNPTLLAIARTLIILTLVIGAISLIYKRDFKSPLLFVALVIAGLTSGLWIENILFDAKYPNGRSALLFVPVYALFLLFLTEHFFKHYSINRTLTNGMIYCFNILLIANFIAAMNISYTTTWRFDAHTKEAMRIIQSKTDKAITNYSISNDWIFEPTINYYRKTLGLKLNPANRNGVDTSDFIYELGEKRKENYQLIRKYEDINTSLLVKKYAGFDMKLR